MTTKHRTRVPKYRLHKSSGQAVVTLSGRDYYLGKHRSNESKAEYRRLIAEYLSGSSVHFSAANLVEGGMSIAELCVAYIQHLQQTYAETWIHNNLEKYRLAQKPLLHVYGHTSAESFGPKALKVVRDSMVAQGLSRGMVNSRISLVKRMLSWAVSEELVPPSIHHALQSVEGLRRGMSQAKETKSIKPVSEESMVAVLPYVSPQIAAMILVQWHTGMRPGEAIMMRGCDLDRSSKVWLYRPESHKTGHHGKSREIWIGEQAQEVLTPFLQLDPQAYLFSPKDAEKHRKSQQAANRKSKITPSQIQRAARRRKNPRRPLNDCYTRVNYRQAIVRACDRAGVSRWSPNQLRHSAATRIRKEMGLEAARTVLGHSSVSVTEIYAELDKGKALEAMEKLG